MSKANEYMELSEFTKKAREECAEPYVAKCDEEYVDIKEYSKRTGLRESTIRYRLGKGRIQGIRMGSRWFVIVKNNGTVQSDLASENAKLVAENSMLKEKLNCILRIVGVESEAENVI